ncbi:hypothetical protein THASP1DRAFT_12675, partial [Thamnocephalis sphaerospora]
LAFVGLLTFAYYGLSLLRTVLDTTIRSGISLNKFGAKRGAWAVVTGCTDGIGKAFAQQLAKAGFNIVLVSRTQSKLDALSEEIAAKYNVETKVVAIDFTRAQPADYERLREVVDSVQVGALINNVGTNHEFPIRFQDEEDSVLENIVEVNVLAQVRITKMVVSQMASRKNGLIINLGSMAGVSPTPLLSIYSGTKAFVRSWSQALGAELAGQGIVVECLDAYFIVSNMSKVRRASYMIPTADTYVKQVLKRIGLLGGAGVPYASSPYLPHAIISWAVERLLPRKLVLDYNHSMQVNIRKRALAKQARAAKSQ